jgi:hypothetical protein
MKKYLSLLLLLLPVSAFAGFQVVEKPPYPVPLGGKSATAGAVTLAAVSYIGEPQGDMELRRGFGRDVKLVDALKQIAPAEWHAAVNPDLANRFDKDRPVTWRGGRYWVEVLDALAAEQGLLVTVDWNRQYLTVSPKVVIASVLPDRPASTTVEKSEPVWVVKPGSFLRAVLNEYAARAGWAVEYNYKDPQTLAEKDLKLGGGMRVEGDFKKFVKELFASLPESAKIRAELWGENDPPTVYVYRKGVER